MLSMRNTTLPQHYISITRFVELLTEQDLTAVESSDISGRSVTNEEPPARGFATRSGPVDTSSPAQPQLDPAQASPKRRHRHGISSGGLLPQATADGTIMNGHQDESGVSAVASAAPVGSPGDGVSRIQRSDLVPPDERDQPEPSLLTMPVAVCTLLHDYVNSCAVSTLLSIATLATGMARRCARCSGCLHCSALNQY